MMKGFAENTYVKKKKGTNWEQFFIKSIFDDGAVELATVTPTDGTILHDAIEKIEREEFTSSYQTITNQITVLDTYPAIDAVNSNEMQNMYDKALVMIGLLKLVRAHESPDVRILTSPSTRVIALNDFGVGKLVITPGTLNIVEHKDMDHVLAVEFDGVKSKYGLAPCSNKTFTSVMWRAKVIDDRDKANCEHVTKELYGKEFGHKQRVITPTIKIGYICAVNFKEINENDEILIFRPGIAKKEPKKREAILSLKSEAKKPRN